MTNQTAAPGLRTDELVSDLDRLLDRTVARSRRIRHALLGVASTDGSFRWTGATGPARTDGDPATVTSPYPIASVTKLYTATATMLLHERGALSLDDRLVDLLPAGLVERLHVLEGTDHTASITVRHLLAQTSGLPDFYEGRVRDAASLAARTHAGEDVSIDLVGILELVRQLAPSSAPLPGDTTGARVQYGNTNYQLLGAIIEQVTQQPLHEVFTELLLAPLGLGATYVFPHAPNTGPAAGPLTDVRSRNRRLAIGGMLRSLGPDGGMVSILDDQLDFMRAIVNGDVFAVPTTWTTMQQFNRAFFPIEYGLGTMRLQLPRWATLPHRMPTLVGHSGSTGSWLYHCPELDVVLAGTLDQTSPPSLPYRLLVQVTRIIQRHATAS